MTHMLQKSEDYKMGFCEREGRWNLQSFVSKCLGVWECDLISKAGRDDDEMDTRHYTEL